jgi:hypothetical protein
MIDYIGIDASLNSTAVCIELSDGTEFYLSFYTKEKADKWMKLITGPVKFHFTQYTDVKAYEYSWSECTKQLDYEKVASNILDEVAACLSKPLSDAQIGMEGYSYSSSAGPLIDLVTFGSKIRLKMLEQGSDLTLYAPMTMKTETCREVYGVDSKGIPRNDIGLAGGKFTKHEMLEAFYQYKRAKKNPLYNVLLPFRSEIRSLKAVPKPIDDLIDAYWAKEVKRIGGPSKFVLKALKPKKKKKVKKDK